MRVVIVDDERPARGFLATLLKACPDVTVVGEAEDGADAIALIDEVQPDLLLLDLEMPGMDGRTLIGRLTSAPPPLIVFVTAYEDYGVKAFDAGAVDYLTKPVSAVRLREAIDRARDRLLEMVPTAARAPEPLDDPRPSRRLERIPVKHCGEIVLLPVNRIVSIVAERELLHLSTDQRERYTITYRLKDLEAQLDSAHFVRLSRGTLVNVHFITRVIPRPSGLHMVQMRGGEELSMSRIQSRVLRQRLLRL